MSAQIGSVTSSCFAQLRKLRKIRRFFSKEACTQIVIALILSKIDYGNALYLDLQQK